MPRQIPSTCLPWLIYRSLALSSIKQELKQIAECNRILEAALASQLKSEVSSSDSRYGHLTLRSDRYYATLRRYDALFPGMVRSSLFLSCYALVEARLDELCFHLQECCDLRVSPADLRDKGLTRARIYIAKVAGMRFPSNSKSWDTIQKLGRIRNLLAHAQGQVKDARERHTIAVLGTARPGAVTLDGRLGTGTPFREA